MIVKKIWHQRSKLRTTRWMREGWYLLGFIPLYTRDVESRGVR